jgi:hypothetical protein
VYNRIAWLKDLSPSARPTIRRRNHDRETTVQLSNYLFFTTWGDYYGKLTDKFGVQWMLNCKV